MWESGWSAGSLFCHTSSGSSAPGGHHEHLFYLSECTHILYLSMLGSCTHNDDELKLNDMVSEIREPRVGNRTIWNRMAYMSCLRYSSVTRWRYLGVPMWVGKHTIGHIWGEVAADRLEVFYFLLFFLCSYVNRLKVNQLDQGATDVHAKPGKSWWGEKKKSVNTYFLSKTRENKDKSDSANNQFTYTTVLQCTVLTNIKECKLAKINSTIKMQRKNNHTQQNQTFFHLSNASGIWLLCVFITVECKQSLNLFDKETKTKSSYT